MSMQHEHTATAVQQLQCAGSSTAQPTRTRPAVVLYSSRKFRLLQQMISVLCCQNYLRGRAAAALLPRSALCKQQQACTQQLLLLFSILLNPSQPFSILLNPSQPFSILLLTPSQSFLVLLD